MGGKFHLLKNGFIVSFLLIRIISVQPTKNLKSPNYEKFHQNFTEELRANLSKELTYHGFHHVMDVLEAARIIGEKENLSQHEWTLLNTAILLHDSGFMHGYNDHEERSCEIASTHLPDYGYSKEDIEQIHGMIRATKIPQKPKNLLEYIIADADLEYLGTDRFDEISESLFQEWQNKDIMHSREDWDKAQVGFISNHRYFTDFCKNNREDAKWANLDRVKKRVEEFS